MSVLPIRTIGDPVLRTRAQEVTEFDDALRRLVADMHETMLDVGGVGLAAPQVGVSLRVFTWAVEGSEGHVVNPVLEVGECRGDGRNDIMYPGCWSELYEDGRPGCRDLISDALGIERRELTGMLSFFVNSSADSQAYRGLGEVALRPGDHITFRALRDTPAAVSACPDTAIPGWRAGELQLQVHDVRSPVHTQRGDQPQ